MFIEDSFSQSLDPIKLDTLRFEGAILFSLREVT